MLRMAFFVESVPFTTGVISGAESLGGSESACLGLARALAARGNDVHIFAIKLADDCLGRDASGVMWHHGQEVYDVSAVVQWDVFISLRMAYVFARPIEARLRLLWNQDMLIGEPATLSTMALSWQMDHIVYVSEYHRTQWEGKCPDLRPIGLVAKNGYDAALVPKDAVKRPNRIIHISRPERALQPILAMWPEVRKQVPDAELHLCRYSSMYDAGGWGKVCAAYDAEVARVNEAVGGITYLGELGKPALYQAIAESAVMWYPGVVDFAETSCVASIEAQANGTPLVCSWKGALPETCPSADFVDGDAMTPAYQAESIAKVVALLKGCKDKTFAYRQRQKAGRDHVKDYTYEAVAAQWEAMILRCFEDRHAANPMGILRSFLHEDDHSAALLYAERLLADPTQAAHADKLARIIAFCERVNTGHDQSPETYGEFAVHNPLAEWDMAPRFHQAAEVLTGVTNLLDIACGNGAMALGFAKNHPEAKVVGIDYSQANIDRANAFAAEAGLADRVTFYCRPVWDMDRQIPDPAGKLDDLVAQHGPFDGLFCGEFLEHVVNAPLLIDTLESYVAPGAVVCYTVPNGPFGELMDRLIPVYKGHVHHFEHDDVAAVFGAKGSVNAHFYHCGQTLRGHTVGHWIIRYAAHEGGAAKPRNYAHRLLTQRPKLRLTVGIIAKNAELDLPRCLDSVWSLADEIVIGDTGSTDSTKAIAAKYGARVLDLTPIEDDPDGFAGARNAVLAAATGDWFLWIDSDERLMYGHHLWRYIESGPTFRGYQIHQAHLLLDSAQTEDKPVRLFRRGPDVQFYGCVHEQPQQHDCNGDIWPVLDLVDVKIAHTGYLTEDIRREKMLGRNRSLLKKDAARFPDRTLGKLLWVREFAQEADLCDEQKGPGTAEAQYYRTMAISLYEQHFADPAHKLHTLGRPFYESALKRVQGAMEFDLGMAGKVGGLPGDARAKSSRVWVRTLADFDRITAYRLAQIAKQHAPDVPNVTPAVAKPDPVETVAVAHV